jgi:hypothetical protein
VTMGWFLCGLFIGAIAGVMTMAMVQINRE